jgi:AraC-like DNA-binding protein
MTTIFYRHNKSGIAPAVEKSVIAFFDLTFVLKGALHYQINGERVTINAKEAIMIPQGSIRERESSQAEYISFNFVDIENTDLPLRIYDVPYDVKLLFAVCDELQNKYESYEEKINFALQLILDSLREQTTKYLQPPLVSKIKRYIRENLSEKLSLEKISATVGYTPNYCDYLFQKETGESIIRYVIRERITESKRLLIEGILPLSEISYQVGFEDYNYFSRTFKKHEGVSPSTFRIRKNI